jgi:hypothetical protein
MKEFHKEINGNTFKQTRGPKVTDPPKSRILISSPIFIRFLIQFPVCILSRFDLTLSFRDKGGQSGLKETNTQNNNSFTFKSNPIKRQELQQICGYIHQTSIFQRYSMGKNIQIKIQVKKVIILGYSIF